MALPLWLTKLLIRTRFAGFSWRARALTDNDTAALRFYSDRVLAAPHEELLDAALVPHAPPQDAIDLNQPTPDAPPSRGAISVGRTDGLCAPGRVPVVLPELRAALGSRATGEDLLVTHGATGALAAALDAFVNPGDRVVLFDPCSPLFALGAKSRRAVVRWVPTATEDGRTRYAAADLERAMRGAKVLLLADPANPTGGTISDEDREHLAWIAQRFGVIVYQDESFGAFREGPRPKALPGLVAGSVSQEFGQPGLRVGWLSGPKALVRACQLCANLNAPQVSPILQQAAARLMAEPLRERESRTRAKRRYTLDRLSGMGLSASAPAGYFAWVPVGELGLDGRAFAERLMREESVFVGAGCAFGPSGTNCVRISFAGDDGRLREGLHRVGTFVARVRNPDAPPVPTLIGEPLEPGTEAAADARPAFSRS